MVFIYGMSVNFILQAIRVLHLGNYTDNDIEMIYDFTRNLDNETLNRYFIANNVISYNNDLELYVEIIDTLIKVFETKEEYEKCSILMKKKKESQKIMKAKKNEYV